MVFAYIAFGITYYVVLNELIREVRIKQAKKEQMAAMKEMHEAVGKNLGSIIGRMHAGSVEEEVIQ